MPMTNDQYLNHAQIAIDVSVGGFVLVGFDEIGDRRN